MQRGPRELRDDFYCWQFRIWYNSRDCLFRHAFKTTAACANCEQGAAKLAMAGSAPAKPRWVELPEIVPPGGGGS